MSQGVQNREVSLYDVLMYSSLYGIIQCVVQQMTRLVLCVNDVAMKWHVKNI